MNKINKWIKQMNLININEYENEFIFIAIGQ